MISSRLNNTTTEQILKIVGQFPPSLFIDVGAARGAVARHLQMASPASRTECFEPWKGNKPHFEKLTKSIRNIKSTVSSNHMGQPPLF